MDAPLKGDGFLPGPQRKARRSTRSSATRHSAQLLSPVAPSLNDDDGALFVGVGMTEGSEGSPPRFGIPRRYQQASLLFGTLAVLAAVRVGFELAVPALSSEFDSAGDGYRYPAAAYWGGHAAG